jgi:MFS superfamily sulfate permease-like transporter
MIEGLLVVFILAWLFGFIPFAILSSLLELLLMVGVVLLIVDLLVPRRGHR